MHMPKDLYATSFVECYNDMYNLTRSDLLLAFVKNLRFLFSWRKDNGG